MLYSAKMYMLRATEKHKLVRVLKSKPKTLRHFKVDPILKIYETFMSRLNLCEIEVTNFPFKPPYPNLKYIALIPEVGGCFDRPGS